MPSLDWIGKKAVVNHHREVPYRLIHCDKDKSFGDPEAGNLLVQGDNLEALKALLPYYAGKVKCIYIDPPYNTGNEGWVYNDNTNSPEIKAWLGSVVGKEAEDLSRHDKWLCMMYPRLRLLKEFLSDDGVIFVSIDDNEAHTLKIMCDDIFGKSNFIASIIWRKNYAPKSSARHFSVDHDYVLIFAKCENNWVPNPIARSEKQDKAYKNPDNDPRGLWRPNNLAARNFYSKGTYPITCPSGRIIEGPPPGSYWRVSWEKFQELNEDNRIWWGKDGNNVPAPKIFLSEVKQGITPQTYWSYEDAGHTQEAKKEIVTLFGGDVFDTPKPEKLIKRILEVATNPGDLVLDSFAGSGTTGAVAHKMGRKHISVEMGEHAHTHIVPRYKKVIGGEQGGISQSLGWQGGGGFRYCTLGEPLFDADGNVNAAVSFSDLAAHVFFCETGSPIPKRADPASPLIGTFQGRAIYLLHNADAIGVASDNAGNVLTGARLDTLSLPEPGFSGARIVYGEGCTVPDDRLVRLGVSFKQIPYQIEGL
jgi:adenine-specific DNA-methyltransferase